MSAGEGKRDQQTGGGKFAVNSNLL